MTFMTNGKETTKGLTEFYFGRRILNEKIVEAKENCMKTGKTESRFWQPGTGTLTIKL